MIKSSINYILPPETKRRRRVAKLARSLHLLSRAHPDIHYAEWVERSEPYTWSVKKELRHKPLISIVVPVFNPPASYLMPMVYSVINQQNYDEWELILVNASTEADAQQMTQDCRQIDERIRVVSVVENKGIAGNTNLGIEAAKGDYIGLLDHDDVLAPQALYEVALSLQQKPRPQFVYSDEDKLAEDGKYRYDPFFKPNWSPYLLQHVNYLNHFSVIEKALIEKVGAYRSGLDGAQDFDLFLRLMDEKPVVAHIPHVLYHWRAANGSTAQDFSAKKNIAQASIRALEEHLDRNNCRGKVKTLPKQPGFYEIEYEPVAEATVAIVILNTPIKEQYVKLYNSVADSLEETNLKIDIFVSAKDNKAFAQKSSGQKPTAINEPSNDKFIAKAISKTDASVTVIINAAISPKHENWLENLVGLVTQETGVGVASPLLYDEAAKTIADAGLVKQDSEYFTLFDGMHVSSNSYFGNCVWGRDVDALSGRIMVMRTTTYQQFFIDFYQSSNEDKKNAFEGIRSANLRLIINSASPVKFYGDMTPRIPETDNFNPNLTINYTKIGVAKTINVPYEANDE